MAVNGYVAFDLGAESGRAMLATLKADRLEITEAHRFLNVPQRLPSGLHWNLLDLWANLVEGLRKCGQVARERNIKLVSLGVDTWGVDFGLVGKSGQLQGLPFAYRDARNEPAMKAVLKKLGEQEIYRTTGIQFMPFNSLFQLAAQHAAEPKLLAQTHRLLMMPDLLHYFFSGKLVNEATIASTTQMIDPRTGLWAPKLLKGLGLPTQFLGEMVAAGTPVGTILPEVAEAAGLTPAQARGLRVIVPGSHDTASAVAAVPVDRLNTASGNWAYLSSGTWSLMGAELTAPLVTDDTRAAGFTNERGVGGKIRFLKNISGLWLVQECRRDLARRGQEISYQDLTDQAAKAEPFRTLVDPNHGPFSAPGDMLAKIAAFAKKTRQPAPTTPGQFVRACLESLALTYRHTLDNLEGLLGRRMDLLHVVGGGGQNLLLNQMTADALGRTVVVGPYEATAIGNALTQALGAGQVEDLLHLRRIVSRSFRPVTYEPTHAQAFCEQRSRFEKLLES
ncbi:MAG: rhamnulokinase [Planctomycetota bacterium]|nr:rhamnulokinase [Planctomycetota bacterium]